MGASHLQPVTEPRPQGSGQLTYSYLNDDAGSIARARRRGPQLATAPVAASTATTTMKPSGSLGLSPGTRKIASGFVMNNAVAKPIAEPVSTRRAASPRTILEIAP